jgi:hypothetical protein
LDVVRKQWQASPFKLQDRIDFRRLALGDAVFKG